MNTSVVQKAIVLNGEGKFLIVKRSGTDDRRPLQWDLPGGQLESGEDLIRGIEREVLEESGLEVSGTQLLFSKTEYRTWKQGEGSVVFLLYATHTMASLVKLSQEHDDSKWVQLEEAISMFEYPLHLEFFNYIQKHKLVL